jgi:hypothetical protein
MDQAYQDKLAGRFRLCSPLFDSKERSNKRKQKNNSSSRATRNLLS